MSTQAHSKIGASSMHRWAVCAGSVRLSAGIEPRTSKYAEEGTQAHELAAYRLKETVYDRHPLASNEEMLNAVEVYVEYVENLGRALHAKYVLVEHQFDLYELYPGLFGTADCVIYNNHEKTLHVLDYKHGQGIPVDVVENEQMMYYGVGALLTLKYPVEKIALHIVQPRCNHPDGVIRKWETTPLHLLDFTADLVDAAKRTEVADAPLVPGEHCRFCPASGICPALQKKANEVAKTEFSPALSYDPLKLSEALSSIPAIEAWMEGVRSFAYAEAEHGRCPPGYKLVAKRATRKWNDPEQVAEFFKKEWPSSVSLLMTQPKPEPLSPAQAEKVVHKKQHEKLAPFIVSVSSGYTLAPESDRRPAAIVDAKSEFGKIADQSVEADFNILS